MTHPFPATEFADVLSGNESYAQTFHGAGLTGNAARGLAIVTCMDSRVDPLSIVGMGKGDVKILRNAGARVTDDVLRTLVLAAYLLEVDRVLVMPHTQCKMASATEAELHEVILTTHGMDTRSLDFHTVPDQLEALQHDLTRIRAYPMLPKSLVAAGAVYDVATGRLAPVDL